LKKIAHNMNDPRGAKCPQLPKVLSGRPDAGPKERAKAAGFGAGPGPNNRNRRARGPENNVC
jgi:hypothetical protein